MKVIIDNHLEASGLLCPEPVMLLHQQVRKMQPGQVIKVTATDTSTRRDIPSFCQFLGHELLTASEEEGTYIYVIRLGG